MRSKPKSEGYHQKLSWLLERFQEGLQLKTIEEDGVPKGFIEYIPSEYNWRGISGANYMIIHCLWIVGKGKGKGYGSALLKACLNDAKLQNKSGVAMVTSSETWLSDKSFFMKYGFRSVDTAPPCFELIVNSFDNHPVPHFNHGWEQRAEKHGQGITIIRSDQCPYFEDAVNSILEVAADRGLPAQIIRIENCKDAQLAPSAYGVFNVLLDGRLITYHPLNKRELNKLLDTYSG
ncbi:GNAT family N-acetyltransferase [Paenibacillus eucommiae]|uniref:L-amino acid N-acyltransferase YncA n=1 Tax=Paenibacillus eucommiae TaxID=1355755 RepID=A0ABS4IZP9_9BACL|nr:GNAT family N-acetyltransferase [Paenibacillus eucommiae]MBP1993036.1 L-amino acid N-acyltransferase YncA [Paenibacillus eucommiae]